MTRQIVRQNWWNTPQGRIAQYAGTEAVKFVGNKAITYVQKNGKRKVKEAYDYLTRPSRSNKKHRGIRSVKRGGRGGRGFVKKSRKRKSKSVGVSYDKFNRSGVVYYEENQGTLTDLKALYLLAGVVAHDTFLEQVVGCVLKRLIEKARIRVVGYSDPIDFYGHQSGGVAGTVEFAIDLMHFAQNTGAYSQAGAVSSATHPTLKQMAQYFAPFFENWSSGYDNLAGIGDVRNNLVPHSFIMRVQNGGTVGLNVSEIRLSEVRIQFKGDISMRVQNRSLADDGSANMEEVSNQPIEGKLFQFSGIPQPKIPSEYATGARFALLSSADGVRAMAANTDTMTELFHIPSRKYFRNSISSRPVLLNPGVVEKYHLSYVKKSLSLEKLMKILRIQYGTAATGYMSNYSIFPTMMLGLEDVIGVDNSDTLSIAFDVKRTVGISVEEKKDKWYKTNLLQSTIGTS